MEDWAFRPLEIETVYDMERWKYGAEEVELYMQPYRDSHQVDPKHLKGPSGCDGYEVYRGDDLVGLFEFNFVAGAMEIGCALRPEVKGKGFGVEFVGRGIDFGISEYQYTGEKVILSVDVSNIAAVKVYRNVGFETEASANGQLRMYKTL